MVVGYSRDTVGKDRRVEGRWSAVGVSVCLFVCLFVCLSVYLSEFKIWSIFLCVLSGVRGPRSGRAAKNYVRPHVLRPLLSILNPLLRKKHLKLQLDNLTRHGLCVLIYTSRKFHIHQRLHSRQQL